MKKYFGIFLTISLLSLITISCEEDEPGPRDWPGILTRDVTDITGQGAMFNAEVLPRGDFDILNYGFAWSQSENTSLEFAEKVIFAGELPKGAFSAKITTTLVTSKKYWVKSFVKTKDYTVYGNPVEFVSLGSQAPAITSFVPSSGNWDDTIRISGAHFSYLKENNIVMFGTIRSPVVSSTDSLIVTTVPSAVNSEVVRISVTIAGNKAVSGTDFLYNKPEISSVSSLTGTFGDTITINGRNFAKTNNNVYFNMISARVTEVNGNFLKAVVPSELTTRESVLKVVSSGFSTTSVESFRLNPPLFTSFEQDSVFKPEEIITIYGKNFSPVRANNMVQIGGFPATVIESTGKQIRAYLPDPVIPEYNVSEFKNAGVNITIAEQECIPSDSLHIWWHSTWTRKKDFPGLPRHNAVAFEINGKGYFGTGLTNKADPYLKDFWEYDPSADTWTRVADLPGDGRASSVGFSINGNGYVGLGTPKFFVFYLLDDNNYYKDFYKYSPLSNSWSRISDFPGIDMYSSASFTIGNYAYVGTGWWGDDGPPGSTKVTSNFWKFDASGDAWTQIHDFPTTTYHAAGFSIGTTGYVYDFQKLYKMGESNWEELQTVSLGSYEQIAFSINGKGYFGLGYDSYSDLWEFDPVTQITLNRPMSSKFLREGASVFVINGKAYIIGGEINYNESVSLKDVWEFDPSKPSL